jgi:hypothetical protein
MMMEAKSTPADQPLAGAAAAAATKQSTGTDPGGRQYPRQKQQAETAQLISEGGCERGMCLHAAHASRTLPVL